MKIALTMPSATAGRMGAMAVMAGTVVVTAGLDITPVVTPPVPPVTAPVAAPPVAPDTTVPPAWDIFLDPVGSLVSTLWVVGGLLWVTLLYL